MKPRALLYHRVSTVDQNPALARDELRTAAARRGFEVAEVIEEVGSGADNNRPGLSRALDLAGAGKVDVVMVWKLDRFGRSLLDLLHNIQTINDAGVRFIAITQNIDVGAEGDPMSRLMLRFLGAVAEYERDIIIERTRLGLAGARARGVRLGRPRSANTPDPEWVRQMRSRGATWREVAQENGCSVAAARRASDRWLRERELAENPTQKNEIDPVEPE